jgi:DNA-binding NarL/FixJ family response regulator
VITIAIADDNAVIRNGLGQSLAGEADLDVVGVVENGLEAVALVLQKAPDVVLMDVSMPVMDGLAATREIALRRPGTRVLVLTLHGQPSVVDEAFAAGASGFLLKTESPARIAAAVRAVHEGTPQLSAQTGIVHRADS